MSDDDFEIRPGRIRDRSSGQGKARTLKAQLRALSNRAGHGGRSGDSGSRRGTGRLARGRIASLRATSRASQRRVIVKARIVRHRGSRFTAAPLAQLPPEALPMRPDRADELVAEAGGGGPDGGLVAGLGAVMLSRSTVRASVANRDWSEAGIGAQSGLEYALAVMNTSSSALNMRLKSGGMEPPPEGGRVGFGGSPGFRA